MPSNTHEGLRHYRKYLRRRVRPFPCTYCGILVLPKDYENHCSQFHNLNSKSCCVWCCGTESWRSGEKNRHSNHLIDCFKRFYDSRQVRTLTQPKAIDSSPTCSEVESFFDHSTSIREWLPPRAFQSIWPPDLTYTPPMTFQDENLNLAASYLQLYLETKDTHDWMQLMVRAVAFESFLRALDSDNGSTRILEFWCWCDGGRDSEDALRQHRHMIAISNPPKGRFEKEVWPQVKCDPQPRPKFPCKRLKWIVSPLHLVNTLGYLSKRQSRCNFTRTPGPRRNNHFYIHKTLPTGYKLPLSTLWPGGVYELLYQEKFQNVSIPRVVGNPLIQTARRQWRQKIKDFYNLERGLVIPVEKRFAPTTTEITPHFIYLTRDRKLYFQPSPENETLNQAAWLQMQFQGGNAFYDAVGEETWTPRPRDQSKINNMMPLVEKIERLSVENEQLKREKNELSVENEHLKREKNELGKENKALKRKWEEEKEKSKELANKLITSYEKEIDNLTRRNIQLEKRIKNCSKCSIK